MPADLREIVSGVCEAENARGMAEADWMNALALDGIEKKHGITLVRFGDDVLAAARAAADEVLAEAADGDAATRQIHESYVSARRRSVAWGRVARHAVLDAQLQSAG